jgi:hypothetical protein
MKKSSIILTVILSVLYTFIGSCCNKKNDMPIQDVIYLLPAGAVKLEGFFENYGSPAKPCVWPYA